MEDALRASGIKPKPGDFVAVDGSVIEAGKGEPFHATVNGEVATDMDTKLNNGDVVELGDGSAIEEPCETAEESIPYSIEEEGRGPIHVLEGQGADGLKRTKTGSVSGLTTEEVVAGAFQRGAPKRFAAGRRGQGGGTHVRRRPLARIHRPQCSTCWPTKGQRPHSSPWAIASTEKASTS